MGKIDFPFWVVAKIRILFDNVKNIIIFLQQMTRIYTDCYLLLTHAKTSKYV